MRAFNEATVTAVTAFVPNLLGKLLQFSAIEQKFDVDVDYNVRRPNLTPSQPPPQTPHPRLMVDAEQPRMCGGVCMPFLACHRRRRSSMRAGHSSCRRQR